jgi:hypothetical protein
MTIYGKQKIKFKMAEISPTGIESTKKWVKLKS